MKTIQKNFIALFAVFLAIASLWFTNRTVAPKKATWEDVRSEAQSGNYELITTKKIWATISQSPDNIMIVDTRQEWEYRTGHIKGSLNFPMEPTWLSRWQKKASLKHFLGPEKDKTIIFY